MSTVGIGSAGMLITCVADTVVVRMVVGMMSCMSSGNNGGFAGNSDTKGVEIVCVSRCCSGSCCSTVGSYCLLLLEWKALLVVVLFHAY